MTSVSSARWFDHVNAVQAGPAMAGWLGDRRSLTRKLSAQDADFHVRRLQQGPARCTADEASLTGLPRRCMVQQREVVLVVAGQPLVYAHTILPLQANAADWPFFRMLGERSLGSYLFSDPLVQRGALQFARLRAGHPLAQRAAAALGRALPRWHARRCVFRRKQGVLVVTEVFSPAIAGREL